MFTHYSSSKHSAEGPVIKACGKIPGFVYLALGDPLQKRNYYRAGWLKFRDDADMQAIMAELSDKKVRHLAMKSYVHLSTKMS